MVSPLARIEADALPSDVSDAACSMWRDTAVQEAMRLGKFQPNDSTIHYFDAFDCRSSLQPWSRMSSVVT